MGSDYLGWIDLPNNYNKPEFNRLKAAAQRIKSQSDVFIVIGIGGSYLGARAAIEMLNHTFYNELQRDERKGPKVYFAGHNMSSTYLNELLETIEGQDISINVISKSGTTTEPAIAFRILKEYMENKYGSNEASKRIYVTTDKSKGALKTLADQEGYGRKYFSSCRWGSSKPHYQYAGSFSLLLWLFGIFLRKVLWHEWLLIRHKSPRPTWSRSI